MQELFLGIIAVMLTILTIELTIVLYYIIIFLREAVIIARRVKTLEGSLEQKMEKLEGDLTLFGGKIARIIFRGFGNFFNKNKKQ